MDAANQGQRLLTATMPELDDCWNRIGVSGDGTCKVLVQHIHCRNCPVYAQAGLRLLDRPLAVGYRRESSQHVAQAKQRARPANTSVVVFRLGAEWLALDTRVFQEVAERRPVHSLPHRRQGVTLGLVNVRGELLICVSLGRLLRLPDGPSRFGIGTRLAVVRADAGPFAFPVDEVAGTHRFNRADLQQPPATLAKSTRSFCSGLFFWQGRTVGFLDWETLLFNLNRSLS